MMINPPDQPVSADTEEQIRDRESVTGMSSHRSLDGPETLDLLAETLHVSKRDVLAQTVRVSTKTESVETLAEIALDHDVVDVIRVPVGRIVDVAPAVRIDNGMTIVPVLEERFVVVKQLYLKEELHIRHQVETVLTPVSVTLRRQTAVVEHIDAKGIGPPGVATRQD